MAAYCNHCIVLTPAFLAIRLYADKCWSHFDNYQPKFH